MTATPDSAARRWPILALGAALFAVVMTVGPIIATRGVDAGGSSESYSGYNVGMLAARSALQLAVEQPAPAAAEPAAAPPGTAATTIPPAPEPAAPAPVTTTPAFPAPVAADSPELGMLLESGSAGLADGEPADWVITVVNESDEYLWGVYAYLEGVGPVPCDARQLEAGATTTCRTSKVVWAGSGEAVAWATAWTIDRMVETFAVETYTVDP